MKTTKAKTKTKRRRRKISDAKLRRLRRRVWRWDRLRSQARPLIELAEDVCVIATLNKIAERGRPRGPAFLTKTQRQIAGIE